MESGIDLSVLSLNQKVDYELQVPKKDEEVVGEKLIIKKEATEQKHIIPNRFKGLILVIVGSFMFCLNSTLSKMAFTLSIGDNTFVCTVSFIVLLVLVKILKYLD